jgi:hypothetical protein
MECEREGARQAVRREEGERLRRVRALKETRPVRRATTAAWARTRPAPTEAPTSRTASRRALSHRRTCRASGGRPRRHRRPTPRRHTEPPGRGRAPKGAPTESWKERRDASRFTHRRSRHPLTQARVRMREAGFVGCAGVLSGDASSLLPLAPKSPRVSETPAAQPLPVPRAARPLARALPPCRQRDRRIPCDSFGRSRCCG